MLLLEFVCSAGYGEVKPGKYVCMCKVHYVQGVKQSLRFSEGYMKKMQLLAVNLCKASYIIHMLFLS